MIDLSSLKKILSSLEFYPKTQEMRHLILINDPDAVKQLPKALAQILKDQKSEPLQILQAIRFSKDCIETFNDEFISLFQIETLPHIERICSFLANSEDSNRGLYFFGADPEPYLAKVGNTILRLALECVWVWAKWFPIDPDCLKVSCYRISLEKLALLNVHFNSLLYFSKGLVRKHLPECMVPMRVLQELRKAVKLDLQQTSGTGSTSLIIQQRLSQLLATELAKDDTQMVFYSDIFRRAYKNSVKGKMNLGKSVDECSSIQLDFTERGHTQNQQVLHLSMQIQSLQREQLKQIEEKRALQKTIKEQADQIKQLQLKVQIQEERLANQSKFVQSQYLQF